MSSWEEITRSPQYISALTATGALYANGKGEGFVKPSEHTGGSLSSALAKQNNTLIHLCTRILAKCEDLQEQARQQATRLAILEAQVKDKESFKLPEKIIDDLSKELSGLSVGPKKPAVQKNDRFYVWQDPYRLKRNEAATKPKPDAPTTSSGN